MNQITEPKMFKLDMAPAPDPRILESGAVPNRPIINTSRAKLKIVHIPCATIDML
jgi:hypothetical protein